MSGSELPQGGLRTGWTTGACASAAAKAATICLSTGRSCAEVEIGLPSGQRVRFPVQRCSLSVSGDAAEAVVVKDAGDDPDVTHGAHLVATVGWWDGPGTLIEGGAGVGTVTRAGLGLTVGQAAINPVPRSMISQAVSEAFGADGPGTAPGVRVVISVPEGERMARQTTNARLGIVGGISILGTTGIVRPFSTESWRVSVEQAVRVLAAQGGTELVLSTGARSERVAMALRSDLPELAFVEAGDFPGAAVLATADTAVRRVIFVGMVGKLAKIAAGVLMTHHTRSRVDLAMLRELTAAVGASDTLVDAVSRANTGRHAYELWQAAGVLPACGDLLCARVAGVLRQFAAQAGITIVADVAMVDFGGDRAVAATVPAWAGR